MMRGPSLRIGLLAAAILSSTTCYSSNIEYDSRLETIASSEIETQRSLSKQALIAYGSNGGSNGDDSEGDNKGSTGDMEGIADTSKQGLIIDFDRPSNTGGSSVDFDEGNDRNPEGGTTDMMLVLGPECRVDVDIGCNGIDDVRCDQLQVPSTQCSIGQDIMSLGIKVINSDCHQSRTTQDEHFSCENGGKPIPEQGAAVEVSCNGGSGSEQIIQAFAFVGETEINLQTGDGELPNTLTCIVKDIEGGEIQRVNFDTSGTVDLFLKNAFGMVQLESCTVRDRPTQSCKMPVQYNYTVSNQGLAPLNVMKVERRRNSDIVDLTPQTPIVELRAGEGTPGEATSVVEDDLLDLCIPEVYETTVTVSSDSMQRGTPCFNLTAYAFQFPGIGHMDIDISCVSADGLNCTDLGQKAENCWTPITYTFDVKNVGTTDLVITYVEVLQKGNELDMASFFLNNKILPSEKTSVTYVDNINLCVDGEYETTVTAKAESIINADTEVWENYESYPFEIKVTPFPTAAPTSENPSPLPSWTSSDIPTPAPSPSPSLHPTTGAPSQAPTQIYSTTPTVAKSQNPTLISSDGPTNHPTAIPTPVPTISVPSAGPSQSSISPSLEHSTSPSQELSSGPSVSQSNAPTIVSSAHPSSMTSNPTEFPTSNPTHVPTTVSSLVPTAFPSANPTPTRINGPPLILSKGPTTLPTADPSKQPTENPTSSPTHAPTTVSSLVPTAFSSVNPIPTSNVNPLLIPSEDPTSLRTSDPSKQPTENPTSSPTHTPTASPSTNPSNSPTQNPTEQCTLQFDLACSAPLALSPDASCSFIYNQPTDCQEQPSRLKMRYNGGDCTHSSNLQGNTFFSCEDYGPSNDGPSNQDGSIAFIRVVDYDDNTAIRFDGFVRVGEDIDINGMGSNLNVTVYDPKSLSTSSEVTKPENILQTLVFHTTCPAPTSNLFLKDRFGSIQLVEFENALQGVVSCFQELILNVEISSDFEVDLVATTIVSNIDNGFFGIYNLTDESAGVRINKSKSFLTTQKVSIDLARRKAYSAQGVVVGKRTLGNECYGSGVTSFTAGAPLPPSVPTLPPTVAPSASAVPSTDPLFTRCDLEASISCEASDGGSCSALKAPLATTCIGKSAEELSFTYIPSSNCNETNAQDRFVCSDLNLDLKRPFTSFVRVFRGTDVFYEGVVSAGQLFRVPLPANTKEIEAAVFTVSSVESAGTLLEQMQLSVACRDQDDLTLLQKYGHLQLNGFVNEDMGSQQIFTHLDLTYTVQNKGIFDALLTTATTDSPFTGIGDEVLPTNAPRRLIESGDTISFTETATLNLVAAVGQDFDFFFEIAGVSTFNNFVCSDIGELSLQIQ